MEKNLRRYHKTCEYNITNGWKQIKVDQKKHFIVFFESPLSLYLPNELDWLLNWFECF
jgi:hypothetical protein